MSVDECDGWMLWMDDGWISRWMDMMINKKTMFVVLVSKKKT